MGGAVLGVVSTIIIINYLATFMHGDSIASNFVTTNFDSTVIFFLV